MNADKPWWYRIPAGPLGVIITCGVAVVIILRTPDITNAGIVGAVFAGGIAGFLTQFVQGMAQARHDERSTPE